MKHYHYRISQVNPEGIQVYACPDPQECRCKPQYWTAEKFGYWSVESCDEALTRQMAERVLLGSSPDV